MTGKSRSDGEYDLINVFLILMLGYVYVIVYYELRSVATYFDTRKLS